MKDHGVSWKPNQSNRCHVACCSSYQSVRSTVWVCLFKDRLGGWLNTPTVLTFADRVVCAVPGIAPALCLPASVVAEFPRIPGMEQGAFSRRSTIIIKPCSLSCNKPPFTPPVAVSLWPGTSPRLFAWQLCSCNRSCDGLALLQDRPPTASLRHRCPRRGDPPWRQSPRQVRIPETPTPGVAQKITH